MPLNRPALTTSWPLALVACVACIFAERCHAALITPGPAVETIVEGRSGLTDTVDMFSDSINRVVASGSPEALNVSRSGEATYQGQTVARGSAAANLSATYSFQPLQLVGTASGGFTASGERLAGHPGPNGTSVSGVSDFDLILDVTDVPAAYSFSGVLYGPALSTVVRGATPAGPGDVLHEQRGTSLNQGVPFNFTGVLTPGRYAFRANAGGGVGISFPASLETGARFENVALTISQLPEPTAAGLALAGAAGLLARRRSTPLR